MKKIFSYFKRKKQERMGNVYCIKLITDDGRTQMSIGVDYSLEDFVATKKVEYANRLGIEAWHIQLDNYVWMKGESVITKLLDVSDTEMEIPDLAKEKTNDVMKQLIELGDEGMVLQNEILSEAQKQYVISQIKAK